MRGSALLTILLVVCAWVLYSSPDRRLHNVLATASIFIAMLLAYGVYFHARMYRHRAEPWLEFDQAGLAYRFRPSSRVYVRWTDIARIAIEVQASQYGTVRCLSIYLKDPAVLDHQLSLPSRCFCKMLEMAGHAPLFVADGVVVDTLERLHTDMLCHMTPNHAMQQTCGRVVDDGSGGR